MAAIYEDMKLADVYVRGAEIPISASSFFPTERRKALPEPVLNWHLERNDEAQIIANAQEQLVKII